MIHKIIEVEIELLQTIAIEFLIDIISTDSVVNHSRNAIIYNSKFIFSVLKIK